MDFRLKVFYEVATQLSFTKASKTLHITQPAISKHIHQLEEEYRTSLFERRGSQIKLTRSGELLLQHAEQLIKRYKQLSYEMNLLSNNFTGELSIGASTTIAQYLLPELLAKFISRYPDIRLNVRNGNSEEIEQWVSDGKLSLGMVEGKLHHNNLHYIPFLEDELVAVTAPNSDYADMEEISLEQIVNIPLVIREQGSGTLEIFEQCLQQHNLKLKDLNIMMQLGSTEAIKRFLPEVNAIGIVSVRAIAREIVEGKLKIIDIENFVPTRQFSFIHQLGGVHGMEEVFMEFAKKHS
ncbi:MAG: LysR substrate-binding domain-containing protein [Marinifilaceae bacterium]